MAFQKSFLMALDNDFNTAVRVGNKDKAVATFSALVGMAISVTSMPTGQLYGMLTKATDVSIAQLSKDKDALLISIAKAV
jgi:hypothetical protein